MKYTKNREGMRTLLLENEEYKSVSRDAYEVMRVHTNLDELDKFLEEDRKEESVVIRIFLIMTLFILS